MEPSTIRVMVHNGNWQQQLKRNATDFKKKTGFHISRHILRKLMVD
jgi:hypothetical protein